MKIGDIINYENYSEAVKWCNENNAKLEEVEPNYENVEIPESGFYDEAGDYIILEEKHTEQKEIRRFQIVEIPEPLPPTKEEQQQARAVAYASEVDPLMSEYTRKKTFNLFEESEEEALLAEIEAKVKEIKSRYPYPVAL